MGLWLADAQRVEMYDAGPFTGGPMKGVLHTTEGNSWPDYQGGTIAPHLTVRPDTASKRLLVRQHIAFNRAAKSLRNRPGGVETNRDGVIQIELVGTCNPSQVGCYYWPRADSWALSDLASIMRSVERATGIRRKAVSRWVPSPLSFGSGAPQRMSLSAWDAWDGWCGHEHVPENDHGDPGALNVTWLVGPTADPVPVGVSHSADGPAFPLRDGQVYSRSDRNGRDSATDRGNIRTWQARMRRRGWRIDVDGLYGEQTEAVVRAFQHDKRMGIDGLLGPKTWTAAWASPIT